MTRTFAQALSGGRLLTAAAILFQLLQPLRAVAQPPATSLTVREERGVYTLVARFTVDQPPSVALAVLTDYEQIPRFMPGVRSSVVRERGAGWAVVEQDAESRWLMFSKRIHLVLQIEEQSNALIFRDRCRATFARYDGAWRLSTEDGYTVVTYELIAEPSFDVPGSILKRILRRDSGRMIVSLQREIAARAASGTAALRSLGVAADNGSAACYLARRTR
ncbi:MAG: cyclase/dehydrase [Acidobacteria bacterium]|nr:cyclase/dehydrase [Acidobacteriota bacterium]